jgi:pimeloyl-ACP methyl ester carboxylesterase
VRGLATDRIVLVGASYGCTVALLAASDLPAVRALGLLSPGTSYFGVDVAERAARFPGRLALFAADDDAASAASVRRFAAARGKPDEATVFRSGGHGVALLASHPALADALAKTLAEAVRR